MANESVSRAVTAENQFTSALRVANRKFSVSVAATAMSATVVLQRKLPGEADSAYRDVKSWTTTSEEIAESVGVWDYRIGVKTGGFTSATALTVLLLF